MNTASQQISASLKSLFIGDALSMPVHWFYRASDKIRCCPPHGIGRMEAAPNDHPSSIMSLHSTDAGGRRGRSAKCSDSTHANPTAKNAYDMQGEVVGDITLKGRCKLWGGNRTHYHHGLQAGDNDI